jgi:hypothetical protein
MAEEDIVAPTDSEEDTFAWSDECIAALARQMMRAHRAGDSKALELEYGHVEHLLTNSILWRHLKRQDAAWSSGRWFDGISAKPEFPSPSRLRLRGEVAWVIGQERWYYDPLDFELELCAVTGTLRGYVLRFGDHRPLAQKLVESAKEGIPCGAWAFVFERRRAERVAAADRGGIKPR